MMPPVATLGVWLEDKSVTNEDKSHGCRQVLTTAGMPSHAIGKAACWLAYRHLDGNVLSPDAAMLIEANLPKLEAESDPQRSARWRGSMNMALGYLHAAKGNRFAALAAFGRLKSADDIIANPTGAVNACRAMALCAAAQAGGSAGKPWHHSAITLYRLAVMHWPCSDVAYCAGYELVAAARAVQIVIALAPRLGLPYQGAVLPIDHLLSIEPQEPFRSTLQAMLPS